MDRALLSYYMEPSCWGKGSTLMRPTNSRFTLHYQHTHTHTHIQWQSDHNIRQSYTTPSPDNHKLQLYIYVQQMAAVIQPTMLQHILRSNYLVALCFDWTGASSGRYIWHHFACRQLGQQIRSRQLPQSATGVPDPRSVGEYVLPGRRTCQQRAGNIATCARKTIRLSYRWRYAKSI